MAKQGRVYEVTATIKVNYWLADDDVWWGDGPNGADLENRVLRAIANDVLDGWISDADASISYHATDSDDREDREFDLYREGKRM